MATPTIRHHNEPPSSGSNLVSNFMPKLTELLLLAGWTQEWINADAIGTGTTALPAWDKTPANSSDAGIVVFRMPANGLTVQWYVCIVPGWNSPVTEVTFRRMYAANAYAGTGELNSGGVGGNVPLATTTNQQYGHAISVSEDGLIVALHGGIGGPAAARAIHFERVRNAAGAATDDLAVFGYGGSSGNNGRLLVPTGSAVPDAIWSATNVAVCLAWITGVNVGMISNTSTPALKDYATGADSSIVGPFVVGSAGLSSAFRLLVGFAWADGASDGLVEVNIDGGLKTYRMANTNAAQSSYIQQVGWPAVPTE